MVTAGRNPPSGENCENQARSVTHDPIHCSRLSGRLYFYRELLKALAENGYAPAQFRLGLLYQLGVGVPHDQRRAVYWFDKAARQDEVGAQYGLAEAYRRGEGVPVTPELAFEWFHRLAKRGYAPAQYQVALAYAEWLGVAREDSAAVLWLQRAGAGGHLDAARRLAQVYRNGEFGVPRDPAQAAAWERKIQPSQF